MSEELKAEALRLAKLVVNRYTIRENGVQLDENVCKLCSLVINLLESKQPQVPTINLPKQQTMPLVVKPLDKPVTVEINPVTVEINPKTDSLTINFHKQEYSIEIPPVVTSQQVEVEAAVCLYRELIESPNSVLRLRLCGKHSRTNLSPVDALSFVRNVPDYLEPISQGCIVRFKLPAITPPVVVDAVVTEQRVNAETVK